MLLGIDVGTSAVKVAVFDPLTNRQVASAQSDEMPIDSPQPGWAEQTPVGWWAGTQLALSRIPSEARSQVKAIGISYQMHGLVLVDERQNSQYRAIIWCDGRATAMGDLIAHEVGSTDALLNHPGNFTAAKIRWVAENEPALLEQAAHAMLPGDYLAMRLTGQAGTTASGLSEMIAWNFVERRPSHEVWAAARARPDQMPPLVPTFGEQGRITAEVAQMTGIPKGTPVTYRAGDQPNNALSLNVFHPGELAAVAGTSGVLYGVSDRPTLDPQQRVNTFLHVNDTPSDPRLGVLLCINGAGSFYSWTRKTLNCGSFEELNALAAQAPPGASGVVAIPFGNGPERMLGNTSPGASFRGLDLNRHTRADVARAALEGIAFAMRYGSQALSELGLKTEVVKAGTGSMFQSPLFRQIFADALGVRLQILDTDGALGAARAAGVGAGQMTIDEAFSNLRIIDAVEPAGGLDEAYGSWCRALAD